MKTMARAAAAAFLLFTACGLSAETPRQEEWIPLFNGKNMDGWTPKFAGHDLGENYLDTYRVEEGVLKVCYDKYEKFGNKFGHLFYKEPFSHYRLRVEYRFTGEQVKEGPGWAFRNSGAMLHCQDPKTMGKGQNFPVSIEVQFLGGKGTGERSTINLCTPGTYVVMDGKLNKNHCINSKSKTYHGDQWVTAEVEVRGSSFKHFANGEEVMAYTETQLDENDGDAKKLLSAGAEKSLKMGYISLQAESHPCEFRKVEILKLKE